MRIRTPLVRPMRRQDLPNDRQETCPVTSIGGLLCRGQIQPETLAQLPLRGRVELVAPLQAVVQHDHVPRVSDRDGGGVGGDVGGPVAPAGHAAQEGHQTRAAAALQFKDENFVVDFI